VVGNPKVIPRNVAEDRALPPQSNSVKTFVITRAAPVQGSGKRLEICQFGRLRGSRNYMKGKDFLVAGACNHPNCLVLPFSVELIRLAA